MEEYDFLLFMGIILLSTKIFGLLSRRVKMPQVVGALTVGVILGPSGLHILHETNFLLKAAEIGVIMLMFVAGLDTDFEELKKNGVASLVIALIGVVVPLAGGYLTYYLFFNAEAILPNSYLKGLFVGILLTATSVSITVETLREMGKLKGKIGTTILGAAIIDDILGIIALTAITSSTGNQEGMGIVFLRIGAFFVFVAVVGFFVHLIFQKMDVKYGAKQRIAIYALAFCFLMSYAAERFFGVADITGAYFSGLILCNIAKTSDSVSSKVSISSALFFTPVFFASVGFKTQLTGFTPKLFFFSIALLLVAMLTKVIGCGLGALLCKFTKHESLCVGIGMISRGEVALIVAQKGSSAGLITPELFPAIVVVVIFTTLVTPILLKIVMSRPATVKEKAII